MDLKILLIPVLLITLHQMYVNKYSTNYIIMVSLFTILLLHETINNSEHFETDNVKELKLFLDANSGLINTDNSSMVQRLKQDSQLIDNLSDKVDLVKRMMLRKLQEQREENDELVPSIKFEKSAPLEESEENNSNNGNNDLNNELEQFSRALRALGITNM